MKSLNSSDLVNTIRRRASIPKNDKMFSETDLLEMASEEMSIGLLPRILELHEDYYLFTEDVPLQDGVSAYTIPYRAIGMKLRDVIHYVDTSV